MTIDRRQALLGAAAAAALSSAVSFNASPALAADKLIIGKSIGSSFPFSGADLGKAKGMFAAEGIDAEVVVFRGDGQMQQAMAAGAIHIGFGSGPGMGYAAKGVPGIAVAAMASEPRNMSLVVMKDGPIKTVDDLKGKRVGVTTAGSLTDWLTRKLSDSKGWGPEGIEVTPMGEMRTRLAAMKSGELAGSVNSIQETWNLVENGEGRLLATFGDAVPHFHTHAIFAHRKLIAENPELVRRFLRAWFKTAAYMRDNRADTVKFIAATMKLPESVVDRSYDYEMKMLSFDGAFDPEAIEVIRLSLKDLGILDRIPEAKELYLPGFAPVKF
ncbi:MAG: ABC-type nitrate/sulfonate/bicarbonate transport system, substrate-binding protein [Hyphomicrobiales bacterium]|nr:ABC-type nitrate/sulfonate/bicarbonate transport system, substrate-binding protein [Hyphomicrobiales bacterium]